MDLVELFPLFSELVLKIRPGSPGTGDPLVVSPSERPDIWEDVISHVPGLTSAYYWATGSPDPVSPRCTPPNLPL